MMTNGKIAAAVVGGYLLGRTRKGKLALSLGMMLAGRKLNPQDLAKTVAGSPMLSGLSDQVRKDLMESTKSAAGSALEARMNSLADSLHERSAELEGGSGGEDDDRADDGGDRDAEEESEPEAEREEPPARTAKQKSAKSAKSTRSAKSTPSRPARAARSRAAKATRGGGDE